MEALSIEEIARAVEGRVLSGDETIAITYVGTNSKVQEANGLFVPIVGEKTDGHKFILDAFANGAVACFTDRELDYREGKAYIGVENTLKALQDLGSYYRNKFNIPVIGITGSVGKTTTKEMVAAALETKYNVLKTEGNMNSQVGLPLMMLKLNKEHEIAVIEMGISEEGEMEKLAKIARPETAIVTNIGVSHIAQLKTRENIRKEKMNIINEFKEGSTLFLNGNDDLLSEIKPGIDLDLKPLTKESLIKSEIITFGADTSCDYKAVDITSSLGSTHFTLSHTREEITLSVLGLHNVYNALAALAVAKHYNIPVSIAKDEDLTLVKGKNDEYKKCSSCGYLANSDFEYCPKCGKQL